MLVTVMDIHFESLWIHPFLVSSATAPKTTYRFGKCFYCLLFSFCMCSIRFKSSIVVFMHDVFHSKARVPRVTWMHSWAKCCGGERLLPTNPIWFQTRPGPVEKCKKLFGRLSRRQWVWTANLCACACVVVLVTCCRCSFQFNCLRLMAWVLRCHRNRHRWCGSHLNCNCQSPKPKSIKVQCVACSGNQWKHGRYPSWAVWWSKEDPWPKWHLGRLHW